MKNIKCKKCGKTIRHMIADEYCSIFCAKSDQNFLERKQLKNGAIVKWSPSECLVCGRIVYYLENVEKKPKYCNDLCRRKSKRYLKNKNKIERERKIQFMHATISEINQRAYEEGMTYGQYVAKYKIQ